MRRAAGQCKHPVDGQWKHVVSWNTGGNGYFLVRGQLVVPSGERLRRKGRHGVLQGVEFSIFPIDFEWALQQCSATALPEISLK